jgi:DNA-binding transcriptional ArsR family regulator
MIDRLRHDIQERLEQLLAEADKLRHALAALGYHDSSTASRDGEVSTPSPAQAGGRSRSTSASATRTASAATNGSDGAGAGATPTGAQRKTRTGATRTAVTGTRTAPGATKRAVLAALANGSAMTAGEVASSTGLGRATISTTLSKLAKSGEVSKAERGYRLVQPATPTA